MPARTPRSTHHTVHKVVRVDAEQAPPDPGPLWLRILRMPLFWALVCGVLALPGYLGGDPGIVAFLLTLVGGWLCGFAFVNTTLRMPARSGLILHVAVAVGAGLLLWLMVQVVPGLLAPKPNPARAFLAVLQLSVVPAVGWVWLALIGRITAMIGARDASKAPPAPQWEAGERGSVVRFRAVPITVRLLGFWGALISLGIVALVVVALIVTGGTVLNIGPRWLLLLFIAVPGLVAYLLLSAILRRRAVRCAVRFDADRLRIEVEDVEHVIRYRDLDRLVWRGEGDSARIEARGSGVDVSLVAGIARTPGTALALPELSQRVVRLLGEAGLASRVSGRASRVSRGAARGTVTFERPASVPTA